MWVKALIAGAAGLLGSKLAVEGAKRAAVWYGQREGAQTAGGALGAVGAGAGGIVAAAKVEEYKDYIGAAGSILGVVLVLRYLPGAK